MDLVETFNGLDVQSIRTFITQGQEEHVSLEFKRAASADLTNNDDKKNLAKVLSGFANSAGGLVIWGVEANRNPQGIDCARAAVEIDPIGLFVNRLNEFTGQAVSPLVDGVQHRSVMTQGTAGFAITLVPESSAGPHMAKFREDRYYKRSGDRFYRMEHFDLEDMFGRRQKPDLHLTLERDVLTSDGNEQLTLYFTNKGRAVARHSGFLLSFSDGVELTSVGGNIKDLREINSGKPVISYIGDHTVIHPNGIRTHLGRVLVKNKVAGSEIKVTASIYCENMRTEHFQFALQPSPAISLEPPKPTDSLEPVVAPATPTE